MLKMLTCSHVVSALVFHGFYSAYVLPYVIVNIFINDLCPLTYA